MGEFDNFTAQANQVITLADQEKKRYHHPYIGTEHLLFGLLKEDGGRASTILENLGLDLQALQQDTEAIIQHEIGVIQRAKLYTPTIKKLGRLLFARDEVRLTQRARRVIEFATEDARRLEQRSIDTEHLLLGILQEGKGAAGELLMSKGISLEQVQSEIARTLK